MKKIIVALIIMTLIVMSGCGKSSNSSQPNSSAETTATESENTGSDTDEATSSTPTTTDSGENQKVELSKKAFEYLDMNYGEIVEIFGKEVDSKERHGSYTFEFTNEDGGAEYFGFAKSPSSIKNEEKVLSYAANSERLFLGMPESMTGEEAASLYKIDIEYRKASGEYDDVYSFFFFINDGAGVTIENEKEIIEKSTQFSMMKTEF